MLAFFKKIVNSLFVILYIKILIFPFKFVYIEEYSSVSFGFLAENLCFYVKSLNILILTQHFFSCLHF